MRSGPKSSGRCAKEGTGRPERLVHEHLARRRAEQILAADHVRDGHVGVVDRVREVVGRHAVGAQDHVIAELRVLEAHVAADEVVHDALALVGHPQADHRGVAGGLARGPLLRAQGEAAARVDERPSLALRLGALGGELLGRAVAAVGAALRQELRGDLLVARAPLALHVRRVVAADARPLVPARARPSAASAGSARSPRGARASRRCPRCAARSDRRCGARRATRTGPCARRPRGAGRLATAQTACGQGWPRLLTLAAHAWGAPHVRHAQMGPGPI